MDVKHFPPLELSEEEKEQLAEIMLDFYTKLGFALARRFGSDPSVVKFFAPTEEPTTIQ